MCTIDRYLLRQYVQIFLICFVSLAGLYMVIDAFGRLDDFSRAGGSFQDAFVAAAKYYGLQSLNFFNRTSGILAMIAAMFTVTWIQRHNELTALMAAGLPRLRVLRPVLLATAVVAVGAAAVREIVIPPLRHELSLDSKDLAGEQTVPLKPRYDIATGILIGGDYAVPARRVLLNPSFMLPPKLSAQYGRRVVGSEAAYIAREGERPPGYLVKGVTQPKGIALQASLRGENNEPLIVTPRDAAWLGKDEAFVVTGVSFELLSAGAQWRDLASTAEIARELASPSTELGPDVRVAVHARLVQPLADMTLLLLGLPLVVSRNAASPFLAIGLSVAVVAAFFLVTLGGQALGAGGWLQPSMAAWLPLLVFGPIAAAQFESLRQ
ncbi:LptF/LptG family permease [Botrimarina hoheduenensis]|uniref:Putative permease YjgP/YjgQ family protein n=1 Tax=Botrimarina hoheduenensis TaxID=2528000 RepID=A0A5C5VY70_9BACT|nr:LptF/LptG family permease [Botrimarina hoheduenensis]TWT42681.1 putative permease YjgP/YjgQ family protein [Botrimarina hoheduenensis]